MTTKRKIIFLLAVMLTGTVYSQVGINTENPLGIFHIDPQGNTTSAGVNISDDIFVTKEGKVGLGVSVPEEKADIDGKLKIRNIEQNPVKFIMQTISL
ncbi:hypothetical protein CLV62_12275 [Dysgonomonas alginatilytica]|uniref:Uncharacterized protein n=1 Tax=Dysgonomonas alginatilytica TaxID=1605892 RepID=A0A2V3PML9_9BACT|nr:hypothetical protein [Dysgonomonas alginatilytica]PXV62120.1 hypothetical protein CLV62_12275 [Dysgonomonas alginatilytica]